MATHEPESSYGRLTGDHPLGGLREIPDEAVQIESSAMKIVGDCEAGWCTPGAFKEALHQESDNLKMVKAGEGAGIRTNPDSLKRGFSGLQEQIDEAKINMFARMIESQAELPIVLADWKKRFIEAKSRNPEASATSEFKRLMSINAVAGDFNTALFQYKERFDQQRTPEISEAFRTVRRAELVGVSDATKAHSLERDLEEYLYHGKEAAEPQTAEAPQAEQQPVTPAGEVPKKASEQQKTEPDNVNATPRKGNSLSRGLARISFWRK